MQKVTCMYTYLTKVFGNVVVMHFDHWFSNTKAFLCSIWNLCKVKQYSLGSSFQ